ncbi:SAM-dependent methyltransferase [Methylopila capsulata]|uniref:SAM-dependent methyltransferase n=1 Tax=Methylopila capsulata TaxID=61654 RepID=A0ABS2T4B7_9HYPH|nr:SAM-dependent methyltransferase [Methylopila capsulata]
MTETADRTILDLLARWERQQEGYIEQREERFGIMFEVLAAVFGDAFTVIDAACGPGSLSLRLLERFPAATVIAVDADAMLLEMARVALAPHAARTRVVEADLADPAWADEAAKACEALGSGRTSALVSTTALHWLAPGALAEFYGAAGEILAAGGIVMNGDHMRFDARWPTLATVARTVRERVEKVAVAKGEDDWTAWWRRAEAIPTLAPLKTKRDAFFASRRPRRSNSGEDCPVEFHTAALRHAGFRRGRDSLAGLRQLCRLWTQVFSSKLDIRTSGRPEESRSKADLGVVTFRGPSFSDCRVRRRSGRATPRASPPAPPSQRRPPEARRGAPALVSGSDAGSGRRAPPLKARLAGARLAPRSP